MLNEYGKPSGAKINTQKSKAMAVGMWVTTVNVMRIMYHENMKILGIHFTSTTSQSALKSWSVVTCVTYTSTRTLLQRSKSQQTNPLCPHVYVSPNVVHRTGLPDVTNL